MQLYDLFKFSLIDSLAALSVEGFHEVFSGDVVSVVNVEFLEKTPQLLFVQNLVDLHCRRYKLGVVNHSIAIIVDLFDNGFDLVIVELEVQFLHRGRQLPGSYHPSMVQVDCLKLLSQLFGPFD